MSEDDQYHCPTCNTTFAKDELLAFRYNGKWVPMCPDCKDFNEIHPVDAEGWYAYIDDALGMPKNTYLGTSADVFIKLAGGKCLGRTHDGLDITMRGILEKEMEEGNTPPCFMDDYGVRFDWGVAWLDGRLENFTAASYLKDLLYDDEARETGLLGCEMIYIGGKHMEEEEEGE